MLHYLRTGRLLISLGWLRYCRLLDGLRGGPLVARWGGCSLTALRRRLTLTNLRPWVPWYLGGGGSQVRVQGWPR